MLADAPRLIFDMQAPFHVRAYENVIEPHLYSELVNGFPDADRLRQGLNLGRKLNLNRTYVPDFRNFIDSSKPWQAFEKAVVLDRAFIAWSHRLFPIFDQTKVKDVKMEFSLLPQDGGHLLSHTDTPAKIVTAVFYMADTSSACGAFACYAHRERPDDDFSFLQVPWDELETIARVPYAPNRAVFFKRTNNSLHGVPPVSVDRRSVTVNFMSLVDRN